MPRRKLYYEKHRMEIISRNADRQAERDAEVECQIYRMYVEVSEKFGLTKAQTSRLLREYTFSEILAGGFVDGKFVPKELFKVDPLEGICA